MLCHTFLTIFNRTSLSSSNRQQFSSSSLRLDLKFKRKLVPGLRGKAVIKDGNFFHTRLKNFQVSWYSVRGELCTGCWYLIRLDAQ